MIRRGVAAAVVTWLALVGPAVGQKASEADWADCTSSDLDKSIAACGRIVENVAESSENRSLAFNNRGHSYADKGDFDRAISDYGRAIGLKASNPDFFLSRGHSYRAKGDHDRAISDYDRAIALAPEMTEAFAGRGLAHEKRGGGAPAIADFRKVLTLPNTSENDKWAHETARKRLAVLTKRVAMTKSPLVRFVDKAAPDSAPTGPAAGQKASDAGWEACLSNDHNKAISACLRIAENTAENSVFRAAAFARRATSYFIKGDWDRAIADYTRAIALNADQAETYYNRGLCHQAKADDERAIADFDLAIALKANNPEFFRSRGFSLHGKGVYHRAISDFSRAIALAPEMLEAFADRGLAHEARGDRAAAIADFRKVLTFSSQSAHEKLAHERARERLAELTKVPAETIASPPAAVSEASKVRTVTRRELRDFFNPATRRIALVIGNGRYEHLTKLPNPAGDAKAVAALLKQHGYAEVILKEDLPFADFDDAIAAFNRAAAGADEVLVYFSGHGVRIAGRDVLTPVDFQYVCPEEAPSAKLASTAERVASASRGIDLEVMLGRLPVATKKLIVIDACRNEPFVRCKTRGNDAAASLAFTFRGLLPHSDAVAPVIFSSTRPGALASDGIAGQRSPFAKVFIDKLGAHPERVWIRLLNEVADGVAKDTGNLQTPQVVSGAAPETCLAGKDCRWN